MSRPGVYVSEAPLPRVVSNPNTSEAVGGFLGTASRGPVDPVLVTSWSDFSAKFGGFSSGATLPDALYQFFNNGGSVAYVTRVLASDAVAATATFNDTAADRLVLNAVTKGVWANAVSVDIVVSSGTFTLTVREQIRGTGVTVERFRDLSMVQTSPRYAPSIINSPTIGSQYISVVDIDKDDAPLADGGVETLAGGSDGVADVVAGDYSAAFDGFDSIDANFIFNAPGVADVSALVAKIDGPTGRADSIIIADTAENQTPDMLGASLPSSAYAASYYPWIYVPDPAPDAVRGGIKKVPPGASVAGMILRTDTSRGVFKAPAGVGATLTGAVANETRLTNTELDALAGMNVNVVRPVPGAGIAAMGARTRAFGTTDQYISVRRTINFVKKRAAEVSQFALFEPNSPALWEQLRVANGAFLSELWQIGGLAGLDFSQAFYVKCDGENNTTQTISNGEVHVEIGIAPAFPAEFVVIRVGQFESDASTVVTEEV
jgi:phage tail sheath protein FI